MKITSIPDSTLHLFSCRQDMQAICEIFHFKNVMALPMALAVNYIGSLQDWLTPSTKRGKKQIANWLNKLDRAAQQAKKVVVWYSHDIQSQLFLDLMCHKIDKDLWGVNVASLLDKARYVTKESVPYLKNPITTFCSQICCVYPEDIIKANCLYHIRRISQPQKRKHAKHFVRITDSDKGLRIYRNGRILNVKPDFYDKTLIIPTYNEILETTGKDVKAARLIGTCLAYLPWEEVGFVDLFLYQRLEHLQKKGKLPQLVDMDKVKW